LEIIFINFFVYVGSAGTIYFFLGSLFTGLKLDALWITRRGRGRVTELKGVVKGVVWMAVSFAISVFMGILLGPNALYFFAVFCWLGWIAFQAFLSARTSLRIAGIAEPLKGSIAIGVGSFIILIIGLGIIAAEALAALVFIPNDMFGIGTAVNGIFPSASVNIGLQYQALLVAYGMMGLFALVSLFAFFKYARRGAALNIALLVFFIAIYGGYFLVNVMRRTGAPGLYFSDILLSLFFLIYALSGIGSTLTEAAEESRARLKDIGPLLTFFLASGFFFVDQIIAVSTVPGAMIGSWFGNAWTVDTYATWILRDVAKLIAFPVAAILSMLYYLRTERVERIVERARDEGVTYDPDEVDEDVAEATPDPGEAWPSERSEGIKEGKPGHDLSAPDPDRLSVDKSRRLGKAKRLDDEDEED
jgi:hypothetical protein